MATLTLHRPSPVLMAGCALALVTLAVVWRPGAPPPGQAPATARDLRFEDLSDGAIRVRDARTGAEIAWLEPGSNAFVRGTLRALVRDRRKEELGAETPFRLTAWPDGRLTLEDPATGRHVALEAFGVTNAGAFHRFLTTDQRRP